MSLLLGLVSLRRSKVSIIRPGGYDLKKREIVEGQMLVSSFPLVCTNPNIEPYRHLYKHTQER